MYSFACQKSTRKAPLFRGAGTNQGLLAPNNPNEVEKSPESGGVPAHRRYSDFGDFSICGAAADFRCILSRVPLGTWCCHGRHSYWSRTRGLTNSLLGCWLRLAAAALFESHWTERKKSAVAKATADFLVGCPVGLEPTVSRSTIWRVNRLRYGHHINAPEGTRTPGPLLRRQLLYPPELRAHVVIPLGSCMVAVCFGTRCEKYNTILGGPCQEQI